MNDLKLIENDLVPVYKTDTGEQVVYGSDLHRVLEVKSRYNDWIRNRIMDLSMEENVDYCVTTAEIKNNPNPKKNHLIKLESAREICLSERTEIGKRIRKLLCRSHNAIEVANNLLTHSTQYKSIYVIKDANKYKIGISHDPIGRHKVIKTSNPLCELIYYSVPIFNAYEIEAMLHNQLAEEGLHVGGEWFSVADANELFARINKLIIEKGELSRCL